MNETVAPGNYTHFTGRKYRVLAVGLHTVTKEPYVTYQAQYDSDEFGPNAIWTQPVTRFFEMVEHEGKRVPRFTRDN